MPAKSQAQRAFLLIKFGAKWMKKHHFDNKGRLPKHVSRISRKKVSRKK